MKEEENINTIAIPIAIYNAKLIFLSGKPENRLFLSLLESFYYNKNLNSVLKSLSLPPVMMKDIIVEAQERLLQKKVQEIKEKEKSKKQSEATLKINKETVLSIEQQIEKNKGLTDSQKALIDEYKNQETVLANQIKLIEARIKSGAEEIGIIKKIRAEEKYFYLETDTFLGFQASFLISLEPLNADGKTERGPLILHPTKMPVDSNGELKELFLLRMEPVPFSRHGDWYHKPAKALSK